MIEYMEGDMWTVQNEVGMFVITTNSTVNNGKLAMGAGIALEAKERYPLLPSALGVRIPHMGFYGFIPNIVGADNLAFLQTKYYFGSRSLPSLVEKSVNAMAEFIEEWIPEDRSIAMNFPAIGYGGLKKSDVLPKLAPLEVLPHRIQVWQWRKSARK